MPLRHPSSRRTFLIYAAITVALIGAVVVLLELINQAMWTNAASNVRSMSKSGAESLRIRMYRDIQSLDAFTEMIIGERVRRPAETVDAMKRFLAHSPFARMAVVDADGKGYFSDGTRADTTEPAPWHDFVSGALISQSYFGSNGLRQITLKSPVHQDGRYLGAVYAFLNLRDYYQPSAMEFFDDRGFSYLISGRNGHFLIYTKNPSSQGLYSDIYSLLEASGNSPEKIGALRAMLGRGESVSGVMDVLGRQTYFYFTPVDLPNTWYLVSMVPLEVMKEAGNYINLLVGLACALILIGMGSMALIEWRRKTLEQEIRARDHREFLLRTLSANIDNVFLIYNISKKRMEYVFDNIERILGIDMAACAQNPALIFDYCEFESGAAVKTAFQQLTITMPLSEECRIVSPRTGESRWVKFTITPATGTGGMAYYIISLVDLTTEKNTRRLLNDALQAAEQANRAKSEFFSAMSHDMRTPLNGIIGMATIAAAHPNDQDRMRDCLAKIHTASRLLLSIINEVLDMSKMESGLMVLDKRPFSLRELIRDVRDALTPMMESKGHRFELNLDGLAHDRFIGDIQRLQQILLNLLSNAVKYTPDQGRVALAIEERPDVSEGRSRLEIRVEDNGIGMTPEFQERIFDSFSRADDERVSGIQGTGLGMSIVRNLVRLMQGSISIASEPDRGSTFTVVISLLRQDAPSLPPAERPEPLPERDADFSGKRILLAEDNPLNMEIARELIGMTGAEVDGATNGRQVVDMFRDAPEGAYSLILLDIQMPVLDGYGAARALRALPRRDAAAIPIIAITANAFAEDIQRALDAGMNGHIAKPIDMAVLRRVLKTWL